MLVFSKLDFVFIEEKIKAKMDSVSVRFEVYFKM